MRPRATLIIAGHAPQEAKETLMPSPFDFPTPSIRRWAQPVMFGLLMSAAASALAQAPAPPTSAMQTCQLGNMTLESGAVIPNFRMTYITHGTLNPERSNAILSIHGLRGDRTTQSVWAGPGLALDTTRYFVVQPDTMSVASIDPNATTSPTRSGMNMEFPRFNIRDMVTAEHRLLTECLNIRRLVAVTGTSMGGIGALQWAVSHPSRMHKVVAITPMARTERWSQLVNEMARRALFVDAECLVPRPRAEAMRLWVPLSQLVMTRTPEALRAFASQVRVGEELRTENRRSHTRAHLAPMPRRA